MNIDIYKNKLLDEQKLIEEELSAVAIKHENTGVWEAKPEEETYAEADENDKADRTEDYGERSGLVATLGGRLNDVLKSLKNIEAGTYGICSVCGNKIEEDRLEANPAAQTCKSCMNKVN
jgi:RNA polymerase-binding transcription factor DksA